MASLFLAPHNDDETLFGSFTILRHSPHVIVCFKSSKQNVDQDVRTAESVEALRLLSASGFEQWQILDTARDPRDELAAKMRENVGGYTHVFAPAREENGHEQHTLVGEVALEVFGPDNVTQYLTYMRGSMRSTSAHEVPFEGLWPAYKLAAMSCYHSQIEIANTLPWFIDGPLREYYAHEPREVPVDEQVERFLDRHARDWAREDALRSVL